jgi:hypothetical protein
MCIHASYSLASHPLLFLDLIDLEWGCLGYELSSSFFSRSPFLAIRPETTCWLHCSRLPFANIQMILEKSVVDLCHHQLPCRRLIAFEITQRPAPIFGLRTILKYLYLFASLHLKSYILSRVDCINLDWVYFFTKEHRH